MSHATDSTLDNASVDSEKVRDFGDDLQNHPVQPTRSILSKIRSRDDDARSLVSNNKGVERIISDLQEGAGQLGPLEQPYDIKRSKPIQTPTPTTMKPTLGSTQSTWNLVYVWLNGSMATNTTQKHLQS